MLILIPRWRKTPFGSTGEAHARSRARLAIDGREMALQHPQRDTHNEDDMATLPHERHIRRHTSNAEERHDQKLERKSRATQTTPSKRSLTRPMEAVFSGADGKWAYRALVQYGSSCENGELESRNAPIYSPTALSTMSYEAR